MTRVFTVSTVPLDDDRPLLHFAPQRPDTLVWLRDGDGYVGWGEAFSFEPEPADRFTEVERAFAAFAQHATINDSVGVPGGGLIAFASFTFSATAGTKFRVPQVMVGRREGVTWQTVITVDGREPAEPPVGKGADLTRGAHHQPKFAGSTNPDIHWLDAVEKAREAIRANQLEKVVLARDYAVWSYEPFATLPIAARLAARFPTCFTFVFDGLVGATPELLLRINDGAVTSQVLAGTIGRSDDAATDEKLGVTLFASEKDRGEHLLAVTSVADVLAEVTDDLHVPNEPELMRLANVQHLATTLTGTLSRPLGVLSLLDTLHPSAAVGGTPRDTALEFIAAYEGMPRGRYAAPIGYVTPDGDGEFGIALRCAEISGAKARLFAGVGVVADSLPEAELAETHLKLLAMQQALATD